MQNNKQEYLAYLNELYHGKNELWRSKYGSIDYVDHSCSDRNGWAVMSVLGWEVAWSIHVQRVKMGHSIWMQRGYF